MKPVTAWIAAASLLVWLAIMGAQGGLLSSTVLMHWPVGLILLFGFLYDLRGSLAAMLVCSIYLVVLRLAGAVDSWTLVGWEILVYGIIGMYPFRFMQIREERKHHYRTLLEYKRGELASLKQKTGELDHQIRDNEETIRARPGE